MRYGENGRDALWLFCQICQLFVHAVLSILLLRRNCNMSSLSISFWCLKIKTHNFRLKIAGRHFLTKNFKLNRWKDKKKIDFVLRSHPNHACASRNLPDIYIFECSISGDAFLYFNEKYAVDFERTAFQWQKCPRYISRKSISWSELLFNRPHEAI